MSCKSSELSGSPQHSSRIQQSSGTLYRFLHNRYRHRRLLESSRGIRNNSRVRTAPSATCCERLSPLYCGKTPTETYHNVHIPPLFPFSPAPWVPCIYKLTLESSCPKYTRAKRKRKIILSDESSRSDNRKTSSTTLKRTLVWMHLTQHNFSYPGFFHLAIKLKIFP